MAVTFAIDISHHQDKNLSLAATRRDGCELAILKAGEGSTFVDPDFVANLAEARAAGQLVAAYWYQRSNATAAQHVAKIRSVVPLDVPVIPDVEENSGGVALTRDLVGQLRAAGYRVPLLYLPLWYWRDNLGSPSLAGLPPLWSSRYPNNRVGLLATEWAEVPASYWSGYGGLDVALLQFTSSAHIAGYQPLDASAYRGTRTELAALLGGQAQEDDMQLTDTLPWWNDDSGKPRQATVAQSLASAVGHAEYIEKQLASLSASVNGLSAALAASTKNPDISLDAVKQIVTDAVKQNIQITGEIHVGPNAS